MLPVVDRAPLHLPRVPPAPHQQRRPLRVRPPTPVTPVPLHPHRLPARSRTTAAAGSSPTCRSPSPRSADTAATPTPSAPPAHAAPGEMLAHALRCSWTLGPRVGVVSSLWSQSPSVLSPPRTLFTNTLRNRVQSHPPAASVCRVGYANDSPRADHTGYALGARGNASPPPGASPFHAVVSSSALSSASRASTTARVGASSWPSRARNRAAVRRPQGGAGDAAITPTGPSSKPRPRTTAVPCTTAASPGRPRQRWSAFLVETTRFKLNRVTVRPSSCTARRSRPPRAATRFSCSVRGSGAFRHAR